VALWLGEMILNIDIDSLRSIAAKRDRYKVQLTRLKKAEKQTSCIEAAVQSASETLASGTRSFVIYGEPQSGKTEMMICLTAKLLDDGHRIVIHLLNDSVQLLQQNLDRFQRSNLSPAAKNFSDVIDPDYSLQSGYHVIFCKKNASESSFRAVGQFTLSGKIQYAAFVKNSAMLSLLAVQSGLVVEASSRRPLPSRRRYLPPPSRGAERMDTRMRSEIILHLRKKGSVRKAS
jgi:hypothetical protein